MSRLNLCGCLCLFLSMAVAAPAQNAKGRKDTQANKPHTGTAPAIYPAAQVDQAKTAATAINKFGFAMLADLAAKRRGENVFISPLSIFTALAMTESGSAGETRTEMLHALAVPEDITDEHLHQSASALLKLLQLQKGVELSIANALWSDIRTPMSANFIQRCHSLYEADATTLDFSKPAAANTINGWVKEKTRGKIPAIVDPDIVSSSAAIITNAVYFHGKWQAPFPKDQTKDGIFHLASGGQKTVPLMHKAVIADGYRGGHGFEAAALPYQGDGTRMYAILPAVGKTPEEALSNVSVEKLRFPDWSNELDLKLPRFSLDYSAALKGPLTQMGMGKAFQPRGDFAPLGSPKFFIGEVLHKTRLEVDEEGTVAAAVTSTALMASVHAPPEKKVLVFDRPFAIVLCDVQTGAVLFAGVIYNP